MTATERIADFTSGLEYGDLPAEVIEKVKVSVLHNLGVALAAGSMADEAVAYGRAMSAYDGGTGARLLVTGEEVSVMTAAYVNGATIHARAQDDVFFPGLTHVGATAIPAVLAVGEHRGSTGEELIAALVAGYEAAASVSEGFAQRTTARGFRATGLYGVLGATAAVGRLMRLDRQQTVAALGLATSMSSGTNQTWVAGTQEWQFQVGGAASAGIRAAVQAAAGGTAAAEALEGSAGFYRAFMGDASGTEEIGRGLGSRWRIHDVTYKPYPVCAILQAPVSELVSLAAEHGVAPEAVSAVRLALTPGEAAYPGTDSTGPFVGPGATLMSAQFCLAVALHEGGVTARDLHRLSDPGLSSLLHSVRVIADPALPARSFRLEVDLEDGRTLRRAFTASDQTYNWGRGEVVAQLHAMEAEISGGRPRVDQLASTVLDLEAHDARTLVTACSASVELLGSAR